MNSPKDGKNVMIWLFLQHVMISPKDGKKCHDLAVFAACHDLTERWLNNVTNWQVVRNVADCPKDGEKLSANLMNLSNFWQFFCKIVTFLTISVVRVRSS